MSDLSTLTPGTYTIDASHSTVGFTARHLMITKVRGRFEQFSGTVEIAENPLDSKVEATIELASVNTGDTQRDGHLRTPEFFDVDQHPTMTFRSSRVEARGGDYVLVGDLTIKGVTHPVELVVDFDGTQADPWGGQRAGFSAETEINRRDWGLDFNVTLDNGGLLVSEKIKINLDVELVKTDAEVAA